MHFDLGDVEHCNDGIDNDGDNDIDCADSGCQSNVLCGGNTGGSETCDDGNDNDGDEDVDCQDDDCNGQTGPNGETCSFGTEQGFCGDQADNDGDGLFDCDDSDCTGSNDPACVNETNINGATCDSTGCQNCFDGNDNEADAGITSGPGVGYADCGSATDNQGNTLPADPACTAAGACGGGNNNTGWTTEEDYSSECSDTNYGDQTSCEGAGETWIPGGCSDTIDNDGDNLIDCLDEVDCCASPDCANTSICSGSSGGEVCDNCIDPADDSNNDGIGSPVDSHNGTGICGTGNFTMPYDDDENGSANCDDGAECWDWPSCNDEGIQGTCSDPTIIRKSVCEGAGGTWTDGVCGSSSCLQCHDCSANADGSGGSASCFVDGSGDPCTSLYIAGCVVNTGFEYPIDNNRDGLANCDDLGCASDDQQCPPPPNEGNINCHTEAPNDVGPSYCVECYDGLDNEPTPDGNGGASGHTGAWDGGMNYQSGQSIEDGADCYDPEAIACFNDSDCETCSRSYACLECVNTIGCPTDPNHADYDARAASVISNCYTIRAMVPSTDCLSIYNPWLGGSGSSTYPN